MNSITHKVAALRSALITLCCVLSLTATPALAGKNCDKDKHDKHGKHPKIKVVEYNALSFGKVIASTRQDGHVTITPHDGQKHVSRGVADLGGNFSAAKFLITGKPHSQVRFELHTRGRMGSPRARLANLTSFPDRSVRLDENGKAWVKVGGDVQLAAGAHTGDFTGRFELEVSYL